MGRYCKDEDVEAKLKGKVTFTDEKDDEKKMHRGLLRSLIAEAESEVELDLSPRYNTPFLSAAGCEFKRILDSRPTKHLIRMLCELKAVVRVLETDFGYGSAADGENYFKNVNARYKMLVDKCVGRKKDRGNGMYNSNQWKYPPLPDLMLNWFNTENDDGFEGMIHVTSSGDGGYPAEQINDPSENFWNATIKINEAL